jgi:hypothetical protein
MIIYIKFAKDKLKFQPHLKIQKPANLIKNPPSK